MAYRPGLPAVPATVPAWANGGVYAANGQVIYGGSVWQCTVAHTAGSTFDTAKFTNLVPGVALTAAASPTTASQIVLADGTYATVAQVLALGGGGVAVASGYTTSLSASTGAVGVAVTMTFTPTAGTWPSGAVITPSASGLTGTFSPTTVSASGSGAVTCTFTPSLAGTGTLSSTTSPAMTNTTGGLAYAGTSGGSSIAYAVTAVAGHLPQSTITMNGGAYIAIDPGQIYVRGPSNVTPSTLDFALGASSTAAPVKGGAGGDYGISPNDNDYGHGTKLDQAAYPGGWSMSGTTYIQANGHATASTRTLYWWAIPTDGSGPGAVYKDGSGVPVPVAVTY